MKDRHFVGPKEFLDSFYEGGMETSGLNLVFVNSFIIFTIEYTFNFF